VRIYGRALDWLDQSIAVGREMDEDYLVAYSIAWKARIKCEQGYWQEAIELAGSVASGGTRSARIVPVTALGTIGRVRVRRGEPGGVLPLTQAIDLGRHGTLQHVWAPVSALSEWHWLQGENKRALEVLREFSERVFETDSAWGKGEVAFWMWMAGGLEEIPAGAAGPFALMISGDWTRAAQEWEEVGCPYEQALALSFGDTDARLSALEIFDRLGARPAGKWLRRILRVRGITSIPTGPRRSTKDHPAGLTSRQAEVMGLLQLGLSNAEIATRLFISVKTAEHHVSAVLSKLGVASRSEVAAMRGTLDSEAD
ncbi:MAG TPA: helix-turn-helix transcriptional regulator, partial [Acidimicrobiia bacterium]